MSCADLFDLDRLPNEDRLVMDLELLTTYIACKKSCRRGSPFVMVANGMPWDTHVFNHEIYQMVVPDLDNIIYQLVNDLEERGLLEDTLVVAMGEFGRTWINQARGRDHYPNAWSLAMAGCGIKGGSVIGETDELGIEVKDSPFDERNLLPPSLALWVLIHTPNIIFQISQLFTE